MINKLLCKIFGHKWEISIQSVGTLKIFDNDYYCKRCKTESKGLWIGGVLIPVSEEEYTEYQEARNK